MRAQTEIEQKLREHVRVRPDDIWLKFRDEQYTWKDALSFATKAANGYLSLGVKPGDGISIMSQNRPEFIWAYLGCLMIGGAFVPLNRLQSETILQFMCKDARVSVIVHDQESRPLIQTLRRSVPGLKTIISFDDLRDEPGDPYFQSFMNLPDSEPSLELPVAPSVVRIIYTSGTTGIPKGIVQNNYEESLAPIQDALDIGPGITFYSCNPLFHAGGLYVGVLGTIRRGATFALGERFSASRFWDECRRYNASATHMFSAMFSMLLLQPKRSDDADNPVKKVLAIGCPPPAWHPFEERFGVRIVEMYAVSDAPGLTINVDGKSCTAGKPAGGSEFRIVDENDNPVGPNVVGEIVFRHPIGQVTEYHNLPDATAEAYQKGWFHSGDLGRIDEDGELIFIGRLKEAIRRRGENVSAWEVASVIETHPKVKECAVFGVPSELGEEEVMVTLVVRDGVDFRPEELVEYCEGRLAHFSVPRFIDVVDALPRTATHKIQSLGLKARGRTSTTWDREAAGLMSEPIRPKPGKFNVKET
jgi:crotonobetaine/carnitine-CoA ligase